MQRTVALPNAVNHASGSRPTVHSSKPWPSANMHKTTPQTVQGLQHSYKASYDARFLYTMESFALTGRLQARSA